jgi:hypothetical protein
MGAGAGTGKFRSGRYSIGGRGLEGGTPGTFGAFFHGCAICLARFASANGQHRVRRSVEVIRALREKIVAAHYLLEKFI